MLARHQRLTTGAGARSVPLNHLDSWQLTAERKSMPKIKVTLSIGYPTATHKDILEIDAEEWASCKTDLEREELVDRGATLWAQNYIEIDAELIED